MTPAHGTRQRLSAIVAVAVALSMVGLLGTWSALPARAATGLISIDAALLQVQSVADPQQWVTPTTVYEGSPARLVLDLSNPGAATVTGITVTLNGADPDVATVASATETVRNGTQSVIVPLDLSVGAWSAVGVPNTSPSLSVELNYAFQPLPSAPAPVPSPTPTPTLVPSPAPASASPSPSSIAPIVFSAPTSTTARLTVANAARGLTTATRRSVDSTFAAMPSGSTAQVLVRGAVPRTGANASDYRRAERQARRVADQIRRIAIARGITTQVLILAPMRVTTEARLDDVQTTITPPSGTSSRPAALTLTPRSGASSGPDSTTTTVPITLAPRPTVLLHGLWSSSATWNSYAGPNGFQQSVNSLWGANAVTGMNTGALLSPFGSVNTVSQNMEIAWTYLQNVRTTLNAHEVDIVAHSMGGIITRRLLHSTHATQARAAIRSVVMLGTPNGGSTCADTWSVAATEPLRPAVMRTFNDSNPGYPGVISSLFYATPLSLTCLSLSRGDSVVPEWSAKAQAVNTLVKASGSDCGANRSSTCDISHTSMTTDRGWFAKYVLPQLALPEDPAEPNPTTPDDIPTDTDVVLSQGTSPAGSVSQAVTVNLAANESLSVSIVTDEPNAAFTASYPSGSGTQSLTLTKEDGQPVYTTSVSGPLSNVTVTLGGSTSTSGVSWTFTKVTN